jgi:hypothetical protein
MSNIAQRLRNWVAQPDNSRLQLHALALEAAAEIERSWEVIAQLLDNTHSHAVRRRAEAVLKEKDA